MAASISERILAPPVRFKIQYKEMSATSLIGKSKELYVASLLVAKNLHVYFPLVDTGFDLVAVSPDGKQFLPIQVKYKQLRTGFTLSRRDCEKFRNCDAVLAFGSGKADIESFYFFPSKVWAKKAEDRRRADDKVVVYLSEHEKWAEKYKGNVGLELAFRKVCTTPTVA